MFSKGSERNLNVILNFLLYAELEDQYTQSAIDYIAEDHVDGEGKEEEEANFSYQDLDEDNVNDLQKWVGNNDLWGLIDEKEGGIIGYINHGHIDRIAGILNQNN